MSRTEIAIVGGGAGCVAFLHHFVNTVDRKVAAQIRIKIFETRSRVGPGLAYQGDCESVLLNRAAETMSGSAYDADAFALWLRWKSMNAEEIRRWVERDLASTYVARPVFGRFLEDFANEACISAQQKGIDVRVVHQEVTAIQRGSRYQLRAGHITEQADRVIIAIGNMGLIDPYGLRGHRCYVHAPYPLQDKLPNLLKAARVCIVGSGLTGVDVAVALKRAGYTGRIDMLSRRGRLPFVRGTQTRQHTLQRLNGSALDRLARRRGGTFSLRDLTRLLRAELHLVGVDWRDLFGALPDAHSLLRREVANAREEIPWQLVLASTNEVIEQAWHKLHRESQITVLSRFFDDWMCRRAPMPKANAELLLQMMNSGQLQVWHGPAKFFASSDGSSIACKYEAGETCCRYDAVVNATGASRWVTSDHESPLVRQLLIEGYADVDERGGLRVDFDTAAMLDVRGNADPNMRLLGHLSCGTYFFVSSLEMIAKRAAKVARQMCEEIEHRQAPDAVCLGGQP